MNKKIADFLFTFGICLIIVGVLAGIILGFVTGEGFNLVPAITVWLLCVVIGTGFVSVSGSVNKVTQATNDDEDVVRLIIEKVKEAE